MAVQAPISRPRVFAAPGAAYIKTRPQQSDGSNTFTGGQFVKMSSGNLAAYVADDTGIYGLTPDDSHTSTSEPYTAPWNELHSVIDPSEGTLFIMNITDGSGTVGSGSTTIGNVTVGTKYSARYLASVDTGCVALDASDSGTAAKNMFQVVDTYVSTKYPDGDASDDFNGRVLVKVIEAGIQ